MEKIIKKQLNCAAIDSLGREPCSCDFSGVAISLILSLGIVLYSLGVMVTLLNIALLVSILQ